MRKLWALCFAAAISASNPASAINTYNNWDGDSSVYVFGCPNGASTYGQVISVHPDRHTLTEFSFWWQRHYHSKGSMVVRGEVYAWDRKKATGNALYESERRTISLGGKGFHKEVFKPEIAVEPDARYVLFVSIDKDYEECSPYYYLGWGAVAGNPYHGGNFVYQRNAGHEEWWTRDRWGTDPLSDLAFIATIR